MSRSYKKYAITKDKTDKKGYHRQIRSAIKNKIRSTPIEELDETIIPHQREVQNDYNYCDWKFVCEGDNQYCSCMKNDGNRNKCKRK